MLASLLPRLTSPLIFDNLIFIAVKSVPIRVESMQEAVLLGLEFVVHVSIFKFNKDKIHFLCIILKRILRLKIVDNALCGTYSKIDTIFVSNLRVLENLMNINLEKEVKGCGRTFHSISIKPKYPLITL